MEISGFASTNLNKIWLVVELTHLKNIRQISSFPQVGVKKNMFESTGPPRNLWKMGHFANRSETTIRKNKEKHIGNHRIRCWLVSKENSSQQLLLGMFVHPHSMMLSDWVLNIFHRQKPWTNSYSFSTYHYVPASFLSPSLETGVGWKVLEQASVFMTISKQRWHQWHQLVFSDMN